MLTTDIAPIVIQYMKSILKENMQIVKSMLGEAVHTLHFHSIIYPLVENFELLFGQYGSSETIRTASNQNV